MTEIEQILLESLKQQSKEFSTALNQLERDLEAHTKRSTELFEMYSTNSETITEGIKKRLLEQEKRSDATVKFLSGMNARFQELEAVQRSSNEMLQSLANGTNHLLAKLKKD